VIAEVIAVIEAKHKSIEGYFLDLGVDRADVLRVQQRLLSL
jgi:hypothetical protein